MTPTTLPDHAAAVAAVTDPATTRRALDAIGPDASTDLAAALADLASTDYAASAWHAWWVGFGGRFHEAVPERLVYHAWIVERLVARGGRTTPGFAPVAKLARRALASSTDTERVLAAVADTGEVRVRADVDPDAIAPETDESFRLLLPKMGPTTYLLWAVLADDLDRAGRAEITVGLDSLATRLGVAGRDGRHPTLLRAIRRLVGFEAAWWNDDVLMVRVGEPTT
jgi:hypothetical protein